MSDAGIRQRPQGITPPRGTGVFMLLALVVVLLLPTLTTWISANLGKQTLWPLALIITPTILGLAGAVLAARRSRYGWAVLSAIWGPVLTWTLFTIVTLISGP